MGNTDTEFYEKIDKRLSETLTPPPVSPKVTGEYNYEKDKEKGDKGEDFLISFLESKGCAFIRKSVKNKEGEHKKFDFLMEYNKREIKYEAKTDMYLHDYGNLVVEFEDRGKPSGISVTEADYFITYFTNLGQIWNIKTEDLKKLIAENQFEIAEFGGDTGRTKMYKIPREEFRAHFKVHEIEKTKQNVSEPQK
jgi:hypothetical protein